MIPQCPILLIFGLLVGFSAIFPEIHAIPIDNGVLGTPDVTCGVDAISVDFRTKNSFGGNVYIKGRHSDPNCHTGATQDQKVSILIPHLDCNVQRARSLKPPGIEITTTVVISFHSNFVTKVDRGFAISCFYMEATKTVRTHLNVSVQPSEPLTQTVDMPTCIYEVLRGGPNGAPVKYARIGEPVYHKWTCESELEGVFCMLVHSCHVEDTYEGERHILVDENGCSVDPFLLQQIEYHGELSAGREAHVFKFADRPQLFFQCQISITVREESGSKCPLPSCPVTYDPLSAAKLHHRPFPSPFHRRRPRNVGFPQIRDSSQPGWTMDATSPRINILDIDDGLRDLPADICPNYAYDDPGPTEYSRNSPRPENGRRSTVLIKPGGPKQVCVSTAAFTIVVSSTIFIAICTILAITIAVYRRNFSDLLDP